MEAGIKVRIVNGYRLIYLPEYHRAMTNRVHRGYVYEHIVEAEKMLGRHLTNNECVHHLDFNRANNAYSNLLVLLHSQHGKLHAWLAAGAPINESCRLNRVNSVKSKSASEPKLCEVCGRQRQGTNKRFCSNACSAKVMHATKVPHPSKEQLAGEITTANWCALGRKYGVSDSAVRKWARKYRLI